ncbi:MAG: GspH/FimT family protein [Halospina sp.]
MFWTRRVMNCIGKEGSASASRCVQGGFTLVELMIVIALLAVIAAVAVPGFQTLVENNQVTSTTNRLVGALNFARSEALREGQQVTLQPVNGDWGEGIEVVMGGDALRRFESSQTRMAISGNAVTFRGNGLATNSETLRLCGDSGGSDRRIDISRGGQVTTTEEDCP